MRSVGPQYRQPGEIVIPTGEKLTDGAVTIRRLDVHEVSDHAVEGGALEVQRLAHLAHALQRESAHILRCTGRGTWHASVTPTLPTLPRERRGFVSRKSQACGKVSICQVENQYRSGPCRAFSPVQRQRKFSANGTRLQVSPGP